jgi:hypothetical protein
VILATNSSKHSGLGLNLIIDSFCIISPIQVDLGFVVIERVIDRVQVGVAFFNNACHVNGLVS